MKPAIEELRDLAGLVRACLDDASDDVRATASLSSEYRVLLRRIRAWEEREEDAAGQLSRTEAMNTRPFLDFLETLIVATPGPDKSALLDWIQAQGEED